MMTLPTKKIQKEICFFLCRYYTRNDKHQLLNAPFVDNSYKWAGGGFLSTTIDLVKFGNAMLYSYQHQENNEIASNSVSENFLTILDFYMNMLIKLQ